MEKRSFGKPPSCGSSTGSKEPIKSELFTKIGTRSAVITARYEHVYPVNQGSSQNSSQNLVEPVKLKQVSFLNDKVEHIYDVPKHAKLTDL